MCPSEATCPERGPADLRPSMHVFEIAMREGVFGGQAVFRQVIAPDSFQVGAISASANSDGERHGAVGTHRTANIDADELVFERGDRLAQALGIRQALRAIGPGRKYIAQLQSLCRSIHCLSPSCGAR